MNMQVVDGNKRSHGAASNVSQALAMVGSIAYEPRVVCCGKTFCQAPFYSKESDAGDQLWYGLIEHRASVHDDAYDEGEYAAAVAAGGQDDGAQESESRGAEAEAEPMAEGQEPDQEG